MFAAIRNCAGGAPFNDANAATRTVARFLWTTFTRFEPAADIHCRSADLVRHQPSYRPPMVIDARMKPWYPDEMFCDPETAATVAKRWNEYFPARDVEMGDSDVGHLDAR